MPEAVDSSIDPGKVTLLTVTYGRRDAYVAELLKRAFAEGIGSAIVIANGPNPALTSILAEYGNRVKLVTLSANMGSAAGYARAIEAAADSAGQYFWLMDDDNAPYPGALGRLLSELQSTIDRYGVDRCAVLAHREGHQADVAAGIPTEIAYPPKGSFVGIDLRLLPFKLKRRTLGLDLKPLDETAVVTVPYAEYGGFLAHRECFAALGLPKVDFLLYGDDHEYTFRLTELGGVIRLVIGAKVYDQEASWFLRTDDTDRTSAAPNARNSFVRYLEDGSDFRIFYTVRNRVWCDRYRFNDSRIFYHVNKRLFLAALRRTARRLGVIERLALIESAIDDGEAARLGARLDLPLP